MKRGLSSADGASLAPTLTEKLSMLHFLQWEDGLHTCNHQYDGQVLEETPLKLQAVEKMKASATELAQRETK